MLTVLHAVDALAIRFEGLLEKMLRELEGIRGREALLVKISSGREAVRPTESVTNGNPLFISY